MANIKFHLEKPLLVASDDEDAQTLAAIDEGIEDADAGRSVSSEEARKRISQRITRSATPKDH